MIIFGCMHQHVRSNVVAHPDATVKVTRTEQLDFARCYVSFHIIFIVHRSRVFAGF